MSALTKSPLPDKSDKTANPDASNNKGESRWWRQLPKRTSRAIRVGSIMIGGDNPIAVQTMTNSSTRSVADTLKQIFSAHDRGADLVRVSCPDPESTTALKQIIKESPVPIIADIHFHYRRAIEAAEAGAACLRVNPGNLGGNKRLQEVVRAARDNDCAIRIGVNAGSLERDLLERYGSPCPEALVESAQRHCNALLDIDFDRFKVSLKSSDALLAIASYRLMAKVCDHPLHIGITEAGALVPGTVKSSFGLGLLLSEGIGDTLRVSLAAPIEDEVRVGYEILKSLGLRHRGVTIVACPSCARQQFDVINATQRIEERLQHIRIPLTVSVIGCIVNGPGEARMADIGLAGGGKNTHQVYIHGLPHHRIKDEDVIEHLVQLVENHAAQMEKQDISSPVEH